MSARETSVAPGMPGMRVGIVGAGTMAAVHAQAWRSLGAELTFFAPRGADEIAARFGGSSAPSVEALLADVEVADICTPTPAHADLIVQALKSDVHVICEKPLTRTADEADTVLAAAEQSDRLLMPAHVLRYFPQYELAHQSIQTGKIGDVAVLRFHRSGPAPRRAWFTDAEVSGGIILDQMVHDLDQALWLAGPVASAFAREVSGGADAPHIRSAHVILTHVNGAISYCRGGWGDPEMPFVYGYDIAGSAGTLSYDSRRNSGMEMFESRPDSEREEEFVPDVGFIADPFVKQLRDLIGCIQRGATPRTTPVEGVAAVDVALAAIQSVADGRPVAVRSRGAGR
ncbi:Gfo/Idh/MocA family protein [Microbacterium sp. A588]